MYPWGVRAMNVWSEATLKNCRKLVLLQRKIRLRCETSFPQWKDVEGALRGEHDTVQDAGGGGLVAKSCPTLATLWAMTCQAPLSMGFSRQKYWRMLADTSAGISLRSSSIPCMDSVSSCCHLHISMPPTHSP